MDLKSKLARLQSVGPLPARDAVTRDVPTARAPTDGLPTRGTPAGESDSAPSESSGPFDDDARRARVQALRARLTEFASRPTLPRREAPVSVAARAQVAVPGETKETPHGVVHLCEVPYDRAHRHGRDALAACLDVTPRELALLALDATLESVPDISPSRLLFFDLETTGLAGGTGTLAFLVGLGFFVDGAFKVEQLFLRQPGEEGPILRYVAERMAAATCLVSFNGKSFDWPLLRSRAVLNRVRLPEGLPHVDLLHCARRVFKFRMQQMRLGELEREVLGLAREGDIDGAEIPAGYFAYLRRGDGSMLPRIFEHNAHDLAALAAVLGHLAHGIRAAHTGGDARDWLGYAHVAARAGDAARALGFAHAAATDKHGRTSSSALTLAGDLCLRAHEITRAAELYEQALGEALGREHEAAALHLKLAKLYEHRHKDLERALVHARDTGPVEGEGACAHRVARLTRRLSS